MSSNKKSRDGGKKPSVFERLGSKPSSVTEDYCKQWAHKAGKEGRKRSRSRSPTSRKEVSGTKTRNTTKQSSKSADSGEWEKSLEHEDELALERKLQMLQRELAKQEEQEHKGKGKKPVAKKRERSSSSSSTSSSSSSETSSESSDSSTSSSVSSSSSSSSSSDSDGEVKEKKSAKKKVSRVAKRSHSSSSRNQGVKAKAKSKKIAKLSPGVQAARKKDSSLTNKKQNRSSPKRQHASSSTSAKHPRESPTYSVMMHSRSPRVKEPELLSRDRRQRRSPESSPTETKRKLPAPVLRRRADDHSPPRGRSRERKSGVAAASSGYDARGKVDKSRDRLLEPGYLVRSRSPVSGPAYREPYPVSPTASSYRDRQRAEPYDTRRGYSPQPIMSKMERKEDLYDARTRRPVSPDPVRRPISTRAKDYPEYEHDWPVGIEQTKIADWDHPDYRRRNRPVDDNNWGRTLSSSEIPWKKSYSPPPMANHSYSEQMHSNRSAAWDPQSKSSSRPDEHKRDRERRVAADEKRSRDSNRRAADPIVPKCVTPAPTTMASRTEELRSPVLSEPSVAAPKADETEETRPSSSAIDAEENFSDFSDDVDEILNRDIQDTDSEKTEETLPVETELESVKVSTETELKVNVEPISQTCEIEPSPRINSPVPSAIENRSTDEDLLGGMDIEQISDEELEDETRCAPVDALEVDWTSLACKREKKTELSAAGARQRWQGKAVLSRLGIANTEGQTDTGNERKPLFDCSSLFRRALSARMDLSFRRSLCNLPVRELFIEHCDDDLSLYKASVDLLLKDRTSVS